MRIRKPNPRATLAFAHDMVAAAIAWALGFWLRFNLGIPPEQLHALARTLPWVVSVQATVFLGFGLYRGMWRYASLPDLKRILMAVAVAAMAAPLALALSQQLAGVPRSVLILDPALLVLIMGGDRFLYRTWKEHRLYGLAGLRANPVLVLGAGDAAAMLVKDLERSRQWRVVGLLDDNPRKHGRMLHGVKVLGGLEDLARIAGKIGVEHAIIAMPSASHKERRRALELCAQAGIKAMTVPSFEDLVSGRVQVSQIRPVELDDLLGRDPVVLDSEGLHRLLTGKVAMVTGAGGSIGTELCRQIARFNPARLVLFEHNEYALYRIEQEFREALPGTPIACIIGDVKDRARLAQVLSQHRPAVVFHAAAYKHVPLMETENAWEAIQNNVLGTYVLAQAAVNYGVEKFVFISTDKAVNPANVMGASKRLAELVCQALQASLSQGLSTTSAPTSREPPRFSPLPRGEGLGEKAGSGTRFVMVRFGNVLGSNGSVIPKFKEQIAKGGPVTVTHPQVQRYFMSIPEACQLVLQAALMGQGGEIFVLDMGEPVKIVDLARDLIRLSGFSEEDIKIVFTGLRPGEKLFEEVLANDESTLPTPHPKLRIAKARAVDGAFLEGLLAWITQPRMLEEDEVKRGLRKWVPEYRNGNQEDVSDRSEKASGRIKSL